MANKYEVVIEGHKSIYNEKSRKLKIYFSQPANGINKDTGILLLIPGFGANTNSKVYKKMRESFADEHNLVTVQCDYFGWEFMQDAKNMSINDINTMLDSEDLIKVRNNKIIDKNDAVCLSNKYKSDVSCIEELNEELGNFNDMGVMQAIDNITALLTVNKILEQNNFNFNKGRIITYGHSHGAYLAYLCNAFAPGLISLIIDNSAWLLPAYLNNKRYDRYAVNDKIVAIEFNYLSSKIGYDDEIIDLRNLYKKFPNKCRIICYHGKTDNLIDHESKKKFCNSLENCEYIEVNDNYVDGEIFKSTNHGLDADFIKFFNMIMNKYNFTFDDNKINLDKVTYSTAKFIYEFDYCDDVPKLKIKNNENTQKLKPVIEMSDTICEAIQSILLNIEENKCIDTNNLIEDSEYALNSINNYLQSEEDVSKYQNIIKSTEELIEHLDNLKYKIDGSKLELDYMNLKDNLLSSYDTWKNSINFSL